MDTRPAGDGPARSATGEGASRRELLLLSALAAFGHAACDDESQLGGPSARRWHVADRLSFGPTPELLAEIERLGVGGFVAAQLDPARLDDGPLERLLAGYRTLGIDNASRLARFRGDTRIVYEPRHATLLRALASRRQLYERLVEFWNDYLNLFQMKEDVLYFIPDHDRDVIRRHALGRFTDLLEACAQSPAMLVYMDNDHNRAGDPNENYARELLELHTVGVEAGYTERDVRDTARALAGWTRDAAGRFRFDANLHGGTSLRVLGWRSSGSNGIEDGRRLLGYLARHPSTSRRIARGLCRRFVSDAPSTALVEDVARVYRRNDTAIRPVLEHLFASEEFLRAGGAKLRRPFALLVAMLRTLGASVDPDPLGAAARAFHAAGGWLPRLGQPVWGAEFPDGHPEDARHWTSAQGVLGRWNLAAALAWNRVPGVNANVAALFPKPAPARAIDGLRLLEHRVLGKPLAPARRTALLDWLGVAPHEPWTKALARRRPQALLALLLATPEMQGA